MLVFVVNVLSRVSHVCVTRGKTHQVSLSARSARLAWHPFGRRAIWTWGSILSSISITLVWSRGRCCRLPADNSIPPTMHFTLRPNSTNCNWSSLTDTHMWEDSANKGPRAQKRRPAALNGYRQRKGSITHTRKHSGLRTNRRDHGKTL